MKPVGVWGWRLVTGRRIELRGFGAFSAKTRSRRLGRNPRTGEVVPVKEKQKVYFRAGKELRQQLDNEEPRPEAILRLVELGLGASAANRKVK